MWGFIEMHVCVLFSFVYAFSVMINVCCLLVDLYECLSMDVPQVCVV